MFYIYYIYTVVEKYLIPCWCLATDKEINKSIILMVGLFDKDKEIQKNAVRRFL